MNYIAFIQVIKLCPDSCLGKPVNKQSSHSLCKGLSNSVHKTIHDSACTSESASRALKRFWWVCLPQQEMLHREISLHEKFPHVRSSRNPKPFVLQLLQNTDKANVWQVTSHGLFTCTAHQNKQPTEDNTHTHTHLQVHEGGGVGENNCEWT